MQTPGVAGSVGYGAEPESSQVRRGVGWPPVRLTACSGGGSGGGGRGPGRVGESGGVGGARQSFGGGGVIVLADDGRLAAQGAGHRRLARLEGIDHVHLKEDSHSRLLESRDAATGQTGPDRDSLVQDRPDQGTDVCRG